MICTPTNVRHIIGYFLTLSKCIFLQHFLESIAEQSNMRKSIHEAQGISMTKDETLTLDKFLEKIKELNDRIAQVESLRADVLRFPRFVEIIKQDVKLQVATFLEFCLYIISVIVICVMNSID